MTYIQKDFSHLKGLAGFSDALLDMHFTLYAGYVANTNALSEQMAQAAKGTPSFAELRRRFGWEFNGMRLHELYFGNLSKDSTSSSDAPLLVERLTKAFGSVAQWEEDFRACGAMRGIGWVVLAYDRESDTLFNTWINEHDLGHLAGAVPIAVMDVFEHAFITEYGLDRAAYMDAFIAGLDWHVCEERLTTAS